MSNKEKPDFPSLKKILTYTLFLVPSLIFALLLVFGISNFFRQENISTDYRETELTELENDQGHNPEINEQENTYTYSPYPNFQYSQNLQNIVDDIIELTRRKGLPVNEMSITLIDVNSHTIAEYQQDQLKFPASVVKLFWMVNLYQQLENNLQIDKSAIIDDLDKMIVRSDNEASSRIVDLLTDTESGPKLDGEDYEEWLQKRYDLNLFFENAGYGDINITQKTFPIPYLDFSLPEGRELQMRNNPDDPTRNSVSTYQASRLIYEIVMDKAVSYSSSQNMKRWLLRDLEPDTWRNIDPNMGYFNPVMAFFGESLPTDLIVFSKAGWTSQTRQEVAFISSQDQKTAYILAIFAEDRLFSLDERLFPEMSRLVYERMNVLD